MGKQRYEVARTMHNIGEPLRCEERLNGKSRE